MWKPWKNKDDEVEKVAEEIKINKKRGCLLLRAIETINGERQDSYGNPEDSFQLIADYWITYLLQLMKSKDIKELNAHDICIMMTLFKIAREQHQKKADNIVDAAGYLGIAGDLQENSCKIVD